MPSVDPMQAYLDRAYQLSAHEITEQDLRGTAAELPPLDQGMLDEIGRQAEELARSQPSLGWALTRVAYQAAVAQKSHPVLRARASWYLGRAANHWGQPKRAAADIGRARRAFVKWKEAGWVAACDWQLNALPWAKPDFAAVVSTLRQALDALEQAGFEEFLPHCRLSLAYGQILTKNYEEARQNIRTSELYFVEEGDTLNQARCWLHEASYLRREDRFEQALARLESAANIFENQNANVDRAKVHYQAGLCHLMRTENLAEATDQFAQAIRLFARCELELWEAMCVSNLGSVYLFRGDLALAEQHYQASRKIFARHQIRGLWADNLHDCGEVNILRGRPEISIRQFRQAAELHQSLGVPIPAAVSITNLGKAYGQSGRYQDALFYLEQAGERLESLASPLRLGTCYKYMALLWSQLGQPALAHQFLDRATRNYQLAGQQALLPELYSYRASAFIRQGMQEEALSLLETSLPLARQYDVRPQAVITGRLLGEALVQAGRYQEALETLERTRADAAALGMRMEEGASLIACGNCYASISEPERAERSFRQALQLSGGAWPEIEWRACIGLGDLATSGGASEQALEEYRRGAQSFAQIRQNFWQPTLVGSYLHGSSSIFDRIIAFASERGSPEGTLFLVEQSKASTFIRQILNHRPGWDPKSQRLNDLQAEIGLVQDHLASLTEKSLLGRATFQYQEMRRTLREKVQAYAELKARLERQRLSGETELSHGPDQFDLALFRKLANHRLARHWLALDYYFVSGQLITVMIGPDVCQVLSAPVPPRSRMALEACEKARQAPVSLLPGDLQALGKLLIPNALQEYLHPDLYLLLAPHRRLHAVPWAALQPEFSPAPLASVCIPAVVPSLQSLALLWQRERAGSTPGRATGFVVGLSHFRGRHPDLPHVRRELEALRSSLGSAALYLAEEEATWENLLKSGREESHPEKEGLSHFAWLHLASHFFTDMLTGRCSGLALWDRDIWLDQLRDLVRLPELVTISACSGNSSFVYEGDEHVDLPTTCLIAGASSVIGSLSPVLDQAAAEFMSAFYRYYLAGLPPARALAQVQREYRSAGREEDHWASFVCVGVP